MEPVLQGVFLSSVGVAGCVCVCVAPLIAPLCAGRAKPPVITLLGGGDSVPP